MKKETTNVPRGTYAKRTWFDRPATKGEPKTGPSQTVPDQTLSVREIMDRYAKGLPLEGQRVPIYSDDPEDPDFLPDPQHLDLAEREALAEMAQDQLDQIQQRRKAWTKQERERIEKEKKSKEKSEEIPFEEQPKTPKP